VVFGLTMSVLRWVRSRHDPIGEVVMLTRVMRHDKDVIWAAWRVRRKETSGEVALVLEEDVLEEEDEAEESDGEGEEAEDDEPPNRPPRTGRIKSPDMLERANKARILG